MPYTHGDMIGKNILNRVNFFLDENITDDKIIVTAVPESTTWSAGSLLTTSAQGDWQPINADNPITDVPIGRVVSTSTTDGTAVIRMTGSDLIYRTEPSHPTYTSRTTLPTIDPAPITIDGILRLEGADPDFIEHFQNIMSSGTRLVVNGDAIWHTQGPQRTVKYSPTKKKKPRKKQEKIKTIKDQMKDIP